MLSEWDVIGRIAIAAALSSIIGFEREAKNKPANVSMHILVGSGAATFVGVALLNTHNWQLGDVNRVAAGVASGVGFLGAGTIFKLEGTVHNIMIATTSFIYHETNISFQIPKCTLIFLMLFLFISLYYR